MRKLSKILAVFLSGAAVLSSCDREELGSGEVKEFFLISPASGSLTLTVDETFRIKYGTVPEEAANTASVEWSIDDPDIATVRNGKITPLLPGETVVSVKCGKFTETINLKVKGIPITSFSVPETINAYHEPREIPLKADPAEANAASLNWYVEDANIAQVYLEDGKAYIRSMTEVNEETYVTVSADGVEPQTIKVTAYAPMVAVVAYTYADNSVLLGDAEGQELDYNLLVRDEEKGLPYLLYMTALPHSKVSVSVDNPKICSAKVETVSNTSFGIGYLWLEGGTEFGTTGVSFTVVMDGVTFTSQFSIIREPLVFPDGVCIYNNDSKRAMAAQEEVMKGQTINLMMTAGGQTSYPAKWTSSDSNLATVKTADGKAYSRNAIVTVSKTKTGTVTISAVDESGQNTRSVVLKVTEEHFTDDVYLQYSGTLDKIETNSLTTVERGCPFKVKLSKYFQKTTWTSSNTDVMELTKTSNSCERVITLKKPDRECTLTIMDASGNKLTYKFEAELSLPTLVAIPDDVNGLKLSYGYALGGKSDWIYMPFAPGSNSVSFRFVSLSTNDYVSDLSSWSCEMIAGGEGSSISVSGPRVTLTTISKRDKQLRFRDRFGNEKLVNVRPSLDFRDKNTWILKEEAAGGTQILPYNNDGTFPSKYTDSVNKVGDDWSDYSWTAYSSTGSYVVDMRYSFSGEAEACNWKGYNDKTGKFVYCGPHSLPGITYMIYHIKDTGLHLYGISDGGSSQYHDHHNVHKYKMSANEATGGDQGQDRYLIYGHCSVCLRVKE